MANGHWGEMATGKNEYQSKWALGQMSTLGPMGIWDKWALRASGYWDKWAFGGKGSLGQRGVLGPMSIGTHRHLGKRAVWSKWANKQMVARVVGRCVEV